MNNETLNRLNAFIADYKKESEEKDAIIKQQNQTLLRISAEIEFIKQHPFDLVLIDGSIENISNIVKGQTEQSIDEECVGCAGPCKVVDVAAKLQKELDDLHETVRDMDVTISDLMDNDRKMNGFLDEYRETVENRDKTIEDQKRTIDHFINCIGGLEAELSTRKEDSAMLMKVVEAVRDWQADPINPRHMIERIRHITKNCLDVPEGPPETPIDDLYKVTVTYAFLEMP